VLHTARAGGSTFRRTCGRRAAQLPLPKAVHPQDLRSSFKLIGQPIRRIDNAAQTQWLGRFYAIDVLPPGLLYGQYRDVSDLRRQSAAF